MTAFRYHLHTLKNSFSQSISLLLTLVFASSIVLCSLAFNTLYTMVGKAKVVVEEELGADVSWDTIHLFPLDSKSDLTIDNIAFLDPSDGRSFISSEKIRFNFHKRGMIKDFFDTAEIEGLVKAFSTLSSKIVRYLSVVDFENPTLLYEDDNADFYVKLFANMFRLKSLPKDGLLVFRDINTQIKWRGIPATSSDMSVIVKLLGEYDTIAMDIFWKYVYTQ